MNEIKNNFFVQNELEKKVKGKRTFYVNLINRLFEKFNLLHRLTKIPDPFSDMTVIEHRLNLYHLLTSVIENGVEGDVVEFGVYTGETALLLQKTLKLHGSPKTLHLYDTFDVKFVDFEESVESELMNNFKSNNLDLPVIHKGLFQDTFPSQLPDKIAFAHIDCGLGGNVELHRDVLLYCLEQLYPRLTQGGICALMDYDIVRNEKANNPGVKMAADLFFADKPEAVFALFGDQGYFKKL